MSKKISLISWNVNGIRAAGRKGFLEWLEKGKYDIVSVQETKVSSLGQLDEKMVKPNGYTSFWDFSTEKKGYSGVATYSKLKPKKVTADFSKPILKKEGRLLEIHFDEFILLNIYFPNGKQNKDRLKYKMDFYDAFLAHLKDLKKKKKPIVFCGDINTAHQEIDLARPKDNQKISGFLPTERAWIDKIEKEGFVDVFRKFHPNKTQYSWWDQRTGARARNVGWRIDYFFVSESFVSQVKEASILDHVLGSDHAPIKLVLEL